MEPGAVAEPREPSLRVVTIWSVMLCGTYPFSVFYQHGLIQWVSFLVLIPLPVLLFFYLFCGLGDAREIGWRAFKRLGITCVAVVVTFLLMRGAHWARFPYLRPRMERLVAKAESGQIPVVENSQRIAGAEDGFIDAAFVFRNEDGLTVLFLTGGLGALGHIGYVYQSQDNEDVAREVALGWAKREAPRWFFFAK